MRPPPPVAAATGPAASEAAAKRRRTRALLLVLGLVALGLAPSLAREALSFQGAPTHSADLATARDTAVGDAVERMTAALSARDEAAFVAVADPRDTRLRARLTASFRGMTRLPATVAYRWQPGSWERPPGLGSRYGDPEAFVAVVQRVYHLRGWDRAPAAEVLGLTFARRDGRWLLVGDGDHARPRGDAEAPEPWVGRDLSVVARPHVLVVGDPARDPAARARLGRVADRVEVAVRDVAGLWHPADWNGRVVVYAVTDPRFVRARFGDLRAEGEQPAAGRGKGESDGHGAAEFSGYVTSVPAADYRGGDLPWMAGSRLVLAPAALGYSDAQLLALARHELTHLATFAATERAPAWITEGAAEYAEHALYPPATAPAARRGDVDVARIAAARGMPQVTWTALERGTYRPALVADDAFYAGTAQAVDAHYTDAWLVALYVADVHGESALRRLLEYAGAPGVDTPAQREAAALRDVLGTDRADLAVAVARYAENLARSL
jgi:hypothetical protein